MLASNEIQLGEVIKENVNAEIEKQIGQSAVVLYMKGNSQLPQCGFSAQVVQILNLLKVEYKTVDILKNEILREEIKRYSNWPTLPQLFIKQKFVGGCDIITQMYQDGSLEELVTG
ncbi:MAG: Grx4 family monothiol glutaredoxin [Deltaproteobacteria bacterium]|nr:Grx4 family monothiol glutaredoxin [Deltaproteobacteria bacterium]